MRGLAPSCLSLDAEHRVEGLLQKAPGLGHVMNRCAVPPRHDAIRTHQQGARFLDLAAPLVKPGGRLVYVTCSVLPEENGDTVDAFLARSKAFSPAPLVAPNVEIGALVERCAAQRCHVAIGGQSVCALELGAHLPMIGHSMTELLELTRGL